MASTEAFGFGFTVELLQKDIDRLQGAENGRRITIAFFCLTVYDWLLTLNSEVRISFVRRIITLPPSPRPVDACLLHADASQIRQFWQEPWSISKALFLVVRIPGPCIHFMYSSTTRIATSRL